MLSAVDTEEQKMANLPSCRSKESVPFVHCGRAMFEPIAVKKRNEGKCYGANICLLAWQVEPSIDGLFRENLFTFQCACAFLGRQT